MTIAQCSGSDLVPTLVPEDVSLYLSQHDDIAEHHRRILAGLASMTTVYEVPVNDLSVVYDHAPDVPGVYDHAPDVPGVRVVHRITSPIITRSEHEITYRCMVPDNIISPDQARTVARIYRENGCTTPQIVLDVLDSISVMDDSYQVDAYIGDKHVSTYRADNTHRAFITARDFLISGHSITFTVEFSHTLSQ